MDISFVFIPIYSLGNLVGRMVATGILMISGTTLPDTIIDNVGLLAMITVVLLLSWIERKFAWNVIILCWGLVMMKIGLLMFNNR